MARVGPIRAGLLIAAIFAPLLLLMCCGLGAVGVLTGEEVPAPSDSPPASPSPATEVRTVSETEEIPFPEETVDDPSLPEGIEEVRVSGRMGTKRLTYEVTLIDGTENDRRLVSEEIIREPVTEVVAIGTQPSPPPEPNM
jgi:resuscitation-promoting factor RpfB